MYSVPDKARVKPQATDPSSSTVRRKVDVTEMSFTTILPVVKDGEHTWF